MIKSLVKAPSTLLSRYTSSLIHSPYKTKMATAGFTYFLADCICQGYIEKKTKEDYCGTRALRQGAVGAFFAAPSLHVWHSNLLPKVVKYCRGNVSRVAVSVLLNETLFATYFISFLLFSFEALKKRSVDEGVQNVQDKFVPAFGASVKFWPWISLINYSVVPIHLRPVFVSCWSVVWQSYLSYLSNNVVQSLPDDLNEEQENLNYYRAPKKSETISMIPINAEAFSLMA